MKFDSVAKDLAEDKGYKLPQLSYTKSYSKDCVPHHAMSCLHVLSSAIRERNWRIGYVRIK